MCMAGLRSIWGVFFSFFFPTCITQSQHFSGFIGVIIAVFVVLTKETLNYKLLDNFGMGKL